MTASLPVELLEHIISFLVDDFSTLTACSLSSKVLLPVCRAAKFHTVTLRAYLPPNYTAIDGRCPPLVSQFLTLLESSTEIFSRVHRVRILDPQNFQYGSEPVARADKGDFDATAGNDDLDTGHTLLKTLSKLSKVTDVLLFSENFVGILWRDCLWLQEGIVSLPCLQTITMEVWSSVSIISSWSCFRNISGLALFEPSLELGPQPLCDPPLSLTTFRLSRPNSIEDVEYFLKTRIAQSLDLTTLRNLALRTGYRSAIGSWLVRLALPCAMTLENMALELSGTADDVFLPPLSLPYIKRLWLVILSLYLERSENLRAWVSWLTALFDACARADVEVVFSLPTEVSQEVEDLIWALFPALAGKRVIISQSDIFVPLKKGLPQPWDHRIRKANENIWTTFYEL
ncbi:hypothetical protein DL96DRAFT_364695 [Flagelloscypha sp. PMI_526]|nr:hypothetical protein DL96DRAFT_364695 [Flagelloscypha sp. PMI_526]